MDEDSSLARIIRGSAVVFLGNLVGTGATFATRILIGTTRGPDEYGLIVLGLTLMNITALVALLGLPEGIARQLPRVGVDQRGRYLQLSVLLSLPLSALVAASLLVTRHRIAAVLEEPGFAPVLAVFALAVPLFVLLKVVVASFRGLEDATRRTVVYNGLYQGGTVTFVGVGLLASVATLYLASAWVGALAIAVTVGGSLLISRPAITLRPGRLPARPAARSFIALSLPLMVSNSAWLLLQYTDSVLLGYFATATAVGIYDAAYTVGRGVLLFVWAVAFLFLPVFSGLHADDNQAAMTRIYRATTKLLAFSVLPVVLLVASQADLVLSVTFGPAFATGQLALVVLSLGFFSHVLVGVNRGALTSIGLTRLVLWGNLAALALNLLLNLALIPRFGIEGAAVASAISYLAANAYWTTMLYRHLAIQPFDAEYAVTMLLSLTTFAAIFRLYPAVTRVTLWTTAAAAIAYVSIHALLVLRFGGLRPALADLLSERDL
jgi:O-antigen/teichoic acid export membrane protein